MNPISLHPNTPPLWQRAAAYFDFHGNPTLQPAPGEFDSLAIAHALCGMTINEKTGAIALPEIDAFISPSLSRDVFLSTRAFQGASVVFRNEPWCSYDLPPIPQLETSLYIRFQFHGQRLKDVSLTHSAPRFGSSWADWSEERELARKAFHESWLAHDLRLSPGYFPWGEILSCYDAKGGSSFIVIRYPPPANAQPRASAASPEPGIPGTTELP